MLSWFLSVKNKVIVNRRGCDDFVVVPAIENGEELCIWVCYSFFAFRSKSATTSNHRTALSDISF